jgi:antitoxin (DNA-binding transcriptional repressor) of toxin-antitoxin stability system
MNAKPDCILTMCHIMCHISFMPSVNMRQLRDTRRLKAWLRAGKTVELRERDEVIARIVPESGKERPVKWPDFAARRKKIFGDRVLPGADLLIEERGRY